jgi:ABC-type Fe3+-hydroxamate transport system substrate-binding protein
MSIKHTDMMGRSVVTTERPIRIISLVPSQTELLYELGLADRVVGITKFCIHPKEWFDNSSPNAKTRVGGTKTVRMETIRSLQPDLIIGNKEENSQYDIEVLSKEFPVWMSDIYTLDDALAMIKLIGELTQTIPQASAIIETIRQTLTNVPKNPSLKKALYLIWNEPIMIAGKNTFIDDLLPIAGLMNASYKDRYPTLNAEEIISLNPELILLSSEPFPFNTTHQNYFKEMLPTAKVIIVDGEAFSWYGSRLIKGLQYLIHLNLTQFEE